MSDRWGERKGNNEPIATRGLLTTTGGADLLHTIPLLRTVKITKIMWYNNTGALVTLILGSQTTALGWLPLFPTIVAINAMDGVWEERQIPAIEFALDTSAGAAGMTGNILVTASAANVLMRLEVREKGA